MMDVKDLLSRIWAAVVAVFFGAFVLSLANTAHARVFPECNPATEAAKFYGAEDVDAWVKGGSGHGAMPGRPSYRVRV